MKIALPLRKKIITWMILATFGLFGLTAKSQTFPYLSFTNATLWSGTALQQGAIYKFPNVAAGVDAFVTIQGIYNGATVNNIDQFGGVGYDGGFQPIVYSSVTGTDNSFARFYIEFKLTNGTTYTFPNLAVTGLDIDGTTSSCLEYCRIDMGGGSADFQSNTPEINVVRTGNVFKAANYSGNNINGIDSTRKEVMFTVRNSSVSALTIDYGTTYTSGGGARNMAAFFGDFEYPGSNPVPVKLASFSAMLIDNKAELKWTTVSEINTSHFVVERSSDGQNFSDAGIVFAKGNEASTTHYSFPDDISTLRVAIIYYRLRSVDIDGKSEYSATRIIRISKQDENRIAISTYPNPVTSELRITIPSAWQNKKVIYELFSANGQAAKKLETASSSQTEPLNVNNLAPGFYIVRVSCNGETAQQKIIKK